MTSHPCNNLSLLQEISLAATLVEHLLHSLPLDRHPHTPSPDSSLDSNQSLHAPQRHGCLLPHQTTPNQSLKPHHSLQGPKSPPRLQQNSLPNQPFEVEVELTKNTIILVFISNNLILQFEGKKKNEVVPRNHEMPFGFGLQPILGGQP